VCRSRDFQFWYLSSRCRTPHTHSTKHQAHTGSTKHTPAPHQAPSTHSTKLLSLRILRFEQGGRANNKFWPLGSHALRMAILEYFAVNLILLSPCNDVSSCCALRHTNICASFALKMPHHTPAATHRTHAHTPHKISEKGSIWPRVIVISGLV
jgi:hypothetical protein